MIVRKSRSPIKWMLTFGLLPSPLKILWYRLRGARLGRGVHLGLGSVILGRESIEIGAHTSLGMFSAIDATRIRIGKRTAIRPFVLIEATEVDVGDDVRISESALIRPFVESPQSRLVVRDRAHIFPFSMIDVTREVYIGEESSIGFGTYVFTHGAYKSKLDGYPVEFAPVHIGKGVWIPCRVFIMHAVTIGDDAVIGTGALVNRDIPAGALAVGTPAKPIRTRDEFVARYSDAEKLTMLGEILDEFGQYLQDYAQLATRVEDGDGWRRWTLVSPGGKRRYVVELVDSAPGFQAPDGASTRVVLQEVSPELQAAWDGARKNWFSIGSRRCSEHLDALGEELREFLRRYGLYFARP